MYTRSKFYTKISIFTLFILSAIFSICYFCIIKPDDSFYITPNNTFNSTIEVDENGNNYILAEVSDVYQLAGVFSSDEKTYNISNYSSISDEVSSADKDILLMNKTYILTNDIKLTDYWYAGEYKTNWTCADLQKNYTFDGNGFKISYICVNTKENIAGFIRINYGIVKNLNLEYYFLGTSFTPTAQNSTTGSVYVGGVCGINEGTITNCTVSGSITSVYDENNYSYGRISGKTLYTSNNNNDIETGGICGQMKSGSITNCIVKNLDLVSAGKHVGGIVGRVTGGSINLCYNYVDVSSSNLPYCRVGGIVGEITAGSISQCYNEGNINYNSPLATFATEAKFGGIAGNSYVSISECINKGNIVYSSVDVGYVGGIVGETTSSVLNCGNYGNLTATRNTSQNLKTDTLYAYSGYTDGYLLKDDNKDVCGSFDKRTGGSFFRPLYTRYNTHLDYKKNSSTRFFTGYTVFRGGIAGSALNSNISNCFNYGSMSVRNEVEGYNTYNISINATYQEISSPGGSVLTSIDEKIKIVVTIKTIEYSYGGITGKSVGGCISGCYSSTQNGYDDNKKYVTSTYLSVNGTSKTNDYSASNNNTSSEISISTTITNSVNGQYTKTPKLVNNEVLTGYKYYHGVSLYVNANLNNDEETLCDFSIVLNSSNGIVKSNFSASDLGSAFIYRNNEITLKCFYWDQNTETI